MPPKDAEAQGASSGVGGCSDRLSGLSDRTLIRILSHLKAWEAVRTCALSKRWGGLWAYASRLDIRQPCCCRSPMALGLGEPRTEAFASFVKNLLLRRRSLKPLDALRLCWSHEAHDGDANTWIAHAFRHGAKEIELSGKHHAVYPLPEYMSFIACDDYTKIRLKTLKLIHVKLDDTTLTQLCSRCSCLEELELTDCRIPAKKIQSTLLKRLTMIRCEIPRGLLVYAPNLVSLWCSRTIGYVPWIENLGSLGADNIKQRAPRKYPDCPGLVSCNLKILKLSRVQLDDTTLTRLWSRCTFLEELELKDCLVDGREIRSTSLRCLTLSSCKFAIESGVHAPNLVSLRCIKPFQYVPWIRNMEFLVTASIVLDDSCLPPDRQWPQDEHDQDESDHDGDFFYAGAAESDDNSDDESNHDDNIFAHSGAEDSDDNNDNESDPECDTDDYYDPGCSEPGDEEDDDCTVGYGEIAEEYKDQPSWYVNQGHNQSEDDPSNDCGGKFGGEGCITLGGDGMLKSLSNVRTMDLLAHSGEMVLRRELESCTDFKNLKTLSLGEWCITPDFGVLATILQRSPNLENLFLHLDMAYKSRVGINLRGSSFACTHLKMVKITCSKRDIIVHKLAEFFRANSIPHGKISVRRTASTGNVNGGAGSQPKRKAQSEAGKREAKQRKAGDRGSPG